MTWLHALRCTPLHNAAGKGFSEIVKLLVQAGADVHIRADKVRTGVAECWCMNLMVILIWSCDHYSWHYTTDYDWDMPLVCSSNKTPHVEVLFLLSLMLSLSMLCVLICEINFNSKIQKSKLKRNL